MVRSAGLSNAQLSPLRVFLTVLTTVFVTETAVMFLLPGEWEEWVKALADACLLTLVLAPVFGWVIVRPLRRAAEIRTRLLKQFVTVQEEERRRVARDLHDEVGQSLTSVLVGLRNVKDAPADETRGERLDELHGIVVQALHEVRRLAQGLRPAALDYLGLGPALQRYAEEFGQTHGITVTLRTQGLEGGLPTEVATAVYRIVQEALTNTARHAAARNCWIVIERQPAAVRMLVEDDGRGFDSTTLLRAGGPHFGLSGMQERAALLNGSVSIDSHLGRGTRVAAWIPFGEENRGEGSSAARG